LGLANLLILLPAPYPLRYLGVLLLVTVLPGLALLWSVFGGDRSALTGLEWVVLGSGLSYALTALAALLLHYLPGPVSFGAALAGYDLLILAFLASALLRRAKSGNLPQVLNPAPGSQPGRHAVLLLLLLLLAAFLRLAWLDYSEFQGDESLAMLSAAQAIAGQEEALFLRSKGPGEVLLPLATWRLAGTINEWAARLPFALAGCLALLTLYLVGQRWFGAGLLVGALWAANGFYVGFGRIVQYQTFIVWMSALAVWCAYRAWADGESRLAPLGGLFLGVGLLFHYDVVAVIPTLLYIAWCAARSGASRRLIIPALAGAGVMAVTVALFYLPFALDPQARLTAGYVGGTRLGGRLLNNLGDFFSRSAVYNSSYYVVALLAVLFAWAMVQLHRLRWGRFWLPGAAAVALGTVLLRPDWWQVGEISLAVLPFAAIFALVFLLGGLRREEKMALAWFAVPALGYLFLAAYPLTHVHNVYPGGTLLAGAALAGLWKRPGFGRSLRYPALAAGAALLALNLYYVWVAFLQQSPEYIQTYPAHKSALFWTPYDELPAAGYFGFPHRAGWKGIGQLYRQGVLAGDYGSNEEPEVTSWYTRWATRGCDPDPEYYFLARDLVDRTPVPEDVIASSYTLVGAIKVGGEERLRILQRTAAPGSPVAYEEEALAFDRSARPEAFAPAPGPDRPTDAIFGGQIRLLGYRLDARRAYPGGRIALSLYWQGAGPLEESYHVFAHLEDGRVWAQSDGVPACWGLPTNTWRPGQAILDQRSLPLPPDMPPGEYPLLVGLYEPEGGKRLAVAVGGETVGDHLYLTTVRVQ
jgi:4-amino-4-deoxy-L-arabinose transferase-like glycosyltransferase